MMVGHKLKWVKHQIAFDKLKICWLCIIFSIKYFSFLLFIIIRNDLSTRVTIIYNKTP